MLRLHHLFRHAAGKLTEAVHRAHQFELSQQDRITFIAAAARGSSSSSDLDGQQGPDGDCR